jgi:hypothetical protein
MNNKHSWWSSLIYVLLTFLTSAPGYAIATEVLFNFEQYPASSTSFVNTNYKGFTFSPDCHTHLSDYHYGVSGAATAPFGKWLGFDQSGCYDGSAGGYNNNYLGPQIGQQGRMYIERTAGGKFSLTSFIFGTGAYDAGGMQVSSSKGGIASFTYTADLWQTQIIDGSLWRDVDWLVFSRIGGSDIQVGFDDLRLEFHGVDEPPTVVLILVSLLLIGVVRRARIGIT